MSKDFGEGTFKFNNWILCSVFNICNPAMIFMLPNEIFYSNISLILVSRITLSDWSNFRYFPENT